MVRALCDVAREPCQVRKEAAISGKPHVLQVNLYYLGIKSDIFILFEAHKFTQVVSSHLFALLYGHDLLTPL